MKTLKPWLIKFQLLSVRERLMMVVGILAMLYFSFDAALLGPQGKKNKALQQQIEQQQTELTAFTKMMSELSSSQRVDPLAQERVERDELRVRVLQAQSVIGQMTTGKQLSEVIRSMIGTTPGLTLVSLKTLPVETFFKAVAAAPAKPANPAPSKTPAGAAAGPEVIEPPVLTLFKHGIEVTVKGNYPVLLAYMQGLQRSPNPVFWGNVSLDVTTYPEATLKMTVYTLSERLASPLG